MSAERIDKATNELLKVVLDAGLIYQKVISFKKSGKGSSLTFTQNSSDPKWKKHPEYQNIVDGWSFFIDNLKNYCETGQGALWG